MGFRSSHKIKQHRGNYNQGIYHGKGIGWVLGRAAGKKQGRAAGKKQGRAKLQAEIDENSEDIKEYKKSLTVRRTEFEALDLEKVNYIKACLLVIYCLLVLWFAYIMFKNKDLKLKQKGILISAMVAYPFIAPPLLIYLYEMIMYIKALMTGEIYKKAELQ